MKEYWIDKESGRVEATYADLSGIVDKNESRDPYGVPTGSVPRRGGKVTDLDGHVVAGQGRARPAARQEGGDHYAKLKVTHFDAVEAWMTPEQVKGHYLGCAIKYLTRYNADASGKGGLLDAKKARHFLDKLIEVSS